MSSGFSKEDLDSFFDTDGVAVNAQILAGLQFLKTIPVILDLAGERIPVYSETEIAAENPTMLCKSTDLTDVLTNYTVTFPALETHEDGYGKTYRITPQVIGEGSQTSRVYLKEI